jgi:curved DNA-binding protein
MAVQYKDYYEILGVGRDASQDDIRKAYRGLAKQYHPDVSKEKNADARYREINEAHEVLKDPDKRAKYDMLGADWQQGQDFTPPTDWQNMRGGTRVEFGGEWDSFSDFFKTIFGQVNGGRFENTFGASRQGRRVVQRDSEVELELSLEDAARGGTHTFSMRSGRAEPQTINVKLPRGIIEGSRIRLPGKAPGGGDIYVTVHIAPHSIFKVEGHNLTRALKIEPWQAVLGGTVAVSTLFGSVDVKIPPGIQNGQKLRLKGKGMPMRDKDGTIGTLNGDLYVRIEINIPRVLTDRQKELWEELAKSEKAET